jgi:hypothetical protein
MSQINAMISYDVRKILRHVRFDNGGYKWVGYVKHFNNFKFLPKVGLSSGITVSPKTPRTVLIPDLTTSTALKHATLNHSIILVSFGKFCYISKCFSDMCWRTFEFSVFIRSHLWTKCRLVTSRDVSITHVLFHKLVNYKKDTFQFL